MKVIILGNGYLGNRFTEIFPESKVVSTYAELVNEFRNYDIVINAAAKTNIDWCEKNKIETYTSNVILAGDVAQLAYRHNKKYVFISSGCIFESKDVSDVKMEDAWPNPGCFYALTKWIAEEIVQELNPESLIVRIRLPLSETPHPRNTITKILNYPYLNDSQESVTVIEDMLPAFKKLVEENAQGIHHLVNAGTISPSEIGAAFGHDHTITTKQEQDTRMKWEGRARRVSTIVGTSKTPFLPDIRERLPQVVEKYKQNG